MKYKWISAISVLVILFSSINTYAIVSQEQHQSLKPEQESSLTIYTYDSLLAFPGYDFASAFEQFAGLDNGTVEVVYFNDAVEVMASANAEKDNPVADLLIGIDNVLVSQARDLDILTPYKANGLSNLVPGLVDALAPDNLLTPYDHGVISLYYLIDQIPDIVDVENFVLDDLKNENIAKELITENPLLSSPGLGFLLSTIAIYGDESAGVEGIVEGDWKELWRSMSEDVRMTDSWSDAFSLLYQEEASRSIMVSYTTSPAFGSCLEDDYSTAALLSHENGKQWGWQQVEGIGLVKNSNNQELAKNFIDWFISEELQNEIYLNQWIYPALSGITVPECFNSSISFDSITPLNDQIPPTVLDEHLDTWLDEWEIAWIEGEQADDGFLSIYHSTLIVSFVAIISLYRNKKKKSFLTSNQKLQ